MDKEIKCTEVGCEEVRIFTTGEQEFFKTKGFKEPKYCKTHSNARKQSRENRDNPGAEVTRNRGGRSHEEPAFDDELSGI